jgi:hypothetical protein
LRYIRRNRWSRKKPLPAAAEKLAKAYDAYARSWRTRRGSIASTEKPAAGIPLEQTAMSSCLKTISNTFMRIRSILGLYEGRHTVMIEDPDRVREVMNFGKRKTVGF